MYTYPNGLRCAASEMRVKSYEILVPLLSSVILIVGLLMIWIAVFQHESGLNTFALAVTISFAYTCAVGAAGYCVFVLWCKPINMSK